jgi:four helix bundle protein
MSQEEEKKQYDLEERTYQFAKDVRKFVKNLPKSIANTEDGRQVVKSSGSVGANYIEANESLSRKDFVMRIKISRKEAKETKYWLRLIDVQDKENLDSSRRELLQEADELMNIFGTILKKTNI